jgi:hypothetical protein
MMVSGMQDFAKQIKELEDHARAYRSRGEIQVVPLTREEADVVESYRRFLAEGYE